jgi:preprotein translocase subunit SecE
MVATAKNTVTTTNNGENFTDKAKRFFKGSLAEFKKVHWPNRKQLYVYTGVVLMSVLIVSIMIWIVDSGLSLILERIL